MKITWFKVDDGFYDNPKVSGIPNAAIGLWVKAGSFCSKHLTDGVITAQQVRALKGTQSQISALIRAGLWVETECDLGAKAYSFRHWFEYQPTRESVEESRQEWAEKKRKSRERKRAEQAIVDNVPRGVTEMSPRGTSGGVTEMSGTSPVPSRPDPTRNSGEGSLQASSPYRAGEASSSTQIPNQLQAAVERARRNGEPEEAILRAVETWVARPGHKTPGLLTPLIQDAKTAIAGETAEAEKNREARARRDAIRVCDMCDEQGYILGLDTAVRCRHDYAANDALVARLEVGGTETREGPF